MNLAATAPLQYTGERVVPGLTPEVTFREHQMRYAFAGQFVPGRIVLDIASGSGIGTDYLRRAGAAVCFGLDLNPAALGYARSRYHLPHLAACDATRLCLASQCVDVVVSFETIEHVTDPMAFLAECARVLRPSGLLICSTPNREITRWEPENPFHVAEMPIPEFSRQVKEFFPDCNLYGQCPVRFPLYVTRNVTRKRIASTLQKLRLKEWVRSRLRVRADPVCPEVEFADCHGDERFAVGAGLPRWPNKPRYAIAVARKCTPSR
jgi:SAM-dependent methyltransferase